MAHALFPFFPERQLSTVLGQPKATPSGRASAALACPCARRCAGLVGTKGVTVSALRAVRHACGASNKGLGLAMEVRIRAAPGIAQANLRPKRCEAKHDVRLVSKVVNRGTFTHAV